MSSSVISYEQYDDIVVVKMKLGIVPRFRWTNYGHYSFRVTETGGFELIRNKSNNKVLIGIAAYFFFMLVAMSAYLLFSNHESILTIVTIWATIIPIIAFVFLIAYLANLRSIKIAKDYLDLNYKPNKD